MRVLSARVEENAEALVRGVALAVSETVVRTTPVKTGRAKANWLPSLDGLRSETVEPQDKSGAAALQEARQVIAAYKLGQTIHITNNLPYIRALNDGRSVQARPAGFVERAIQAGVQAVAEKKLLE